MAMRVLRGWTNGLVRFANYEIKSEGWKSQFLEIFDRHPIALDLWASDPECRDQVLVKKLQYQIKMYLSLIADKTFRGRPIAPLHPDDLLSLLEEYGSEEGFSYSVRVFKKSDKGFKIYNQAKIIPWGKDKIRIIKTPDFKSLKQYYYTALVEAIESGEILKVAKCLYRQCGKFSHAKKANRKTFCGDSCRWTYNNKRLDRKEQIKNARRKESDRKKKAPALRQISDMVAKKIAAEIKEGKRRPIVVRRKANN